MKSDWEITLRIMIVFLLFVMALLIIAYSIDRISF